MTRRGLLPHLLSLLGFTAVAVAWALFILGKGGGLPSLGKDPYEVTAVIPTGAALAPGSRVTMAGVDVGRVKQVQREGAGAMLKLQITDDAVLPLAVDSRVQVRQHTPVGENYIAIVAGRSAQKLQSGEGLAADHADEFVDVDKVLSVLKGDTRERARETIRGLGGALDGRGDELNALLGGAGRFLEPASHVVDVLQQDKVKAARLVDQLGDVAAAVGQRDAAITTIADQGLTSLAAIRSRDDALRDTIEQLPSSLRAIRSASGTVRRVSGVARPVVDDATAALTALRPAVTALRPAADDGRAVVRSLGAAAPGLQDTLKGVTALSGPLPQALPALHRAVCQLAPAVRYLRPYVPDSLHILMGLGSSSNSYDATGHLIRLAPVLGENSISGAPAEVSTAAQQLLHAGIIGDAAGTKIEFQPFPKPGDLGKAVATSGSPIGPEAVPATGYRYPRIEADC